jgi:hypothetical protein
MTHKRITRADERHEDIMIEYDKVITELGEEIAPYFLKRRIYEIIADRLKWSTEHVQSVIRKELRKTKNNR